jgi:Na+/H+ antiporter NhaD/arsenite permease-like protein
MSDTSATSTDQIKNWRSIVTLIVFVVTNIVVLFPQRIPVYIPRFFSDAVLHLLSYLRITRKRQKQSPPHGKQDFFIKTHFRLNFVTAPLIADLFLLAILAIGGQEVKAGTLGAEHIEPIDIMAFFITLAYIAISIDASGLVRYLAFKVVQKGGKYGRGLFLYLYMFFFGLGTFIGNDPIILSGTAFLAYMTRVSHNIKRPTAWIHAQFTVANICSAILVPSNPTNLVLANAFEIKFITYTANMIVPVFITAIVLFPFLLYVVFNNKDLIPARIEIEELSPEEKAKKPVNPNIPHARGIDEEEAEALGDDERRKLLSLEEIMNPFVDHKGAAFGAFIMATTLITVLALNAASQSTGAHPVFWVTLPAAFVMFCWDVGSGWINRHDTRKTARKYREDDAKDREEKAERAFREKEAERAARELQEPDANAAYELSLRKTLSPDAKRQSQSDAGASSRNSPEPRGTEKTDNIKIVANGIEKRQTDDTLQPESKDTTSREEVEDEILESSEDVIDLEKGDDAQKEKRTVVSTFEDCKIWAQETFPTVVAVVSHLPFALIPFAFSMFVLVQALVTKGWVPVFAYGWDHWVVKTGTVGAIGGMGFLSVILCNVSNAHLKQTLLTQRRKG